MNIISKEVSKKEIYNSLNDNSNFENDFIKNITNRYKKEIEILKSYINKLNHEIRKKLNIEIPLLSEELLKETNTNELLKIFNESLSKLQNFEYINPIFKLYEENIKKLEEELKIYKKLNKSYENQITEFVKENNYLRECIIIKETELRDQYRIKLSNSDKMIYDEDYIRMVDERNNILSRENEIILNNFHKISQELLDYQIIFNEKHRENIEKINHFDNLKEELDRVNNIVDNLILNNKINEDKIVDLTDKNSKLEIDKNNLLLQIENLKNENKGINEALEFYKNYIYNINN
jgi:hypothetical protein